MSDNPYGGFLGDLLNILGQQGPNAWFDTARSLALTVARKDDGDPNPEPTERQRFEQFSPIVARHVGALFEVSLDHDINVATRTALTVAALDQWRPLVNPMIDNAALASPPALADDDEGMFGQFAATIGPLFTGFQLGSVAGHYSDRAWSLAALALPRESRELIVVANNVARFAEDWSLDRDATAVFALAREMAASVVLTQPGTGDALRALLLESVRDSVAAQGDLMDRIARSVTPETLASLAGDPSSLLDGLDAPEPTAATRAVDAATAALRAVFDAVAFSVCEQMLGPVGALREAYRRYRMADARGEDAAAALFGIATHGDHQGAADTFVAHILTADGFDGFSPLLHADGLPTYAELWLPDAWRERVAASPLA